MKSKYAIFLNIKVTKIELSTFLGTPGIVLIKWKKVENEEMLQINSILVSK